MSIHVHTADVDIDDVTKMFEELILHSFFCRGGGVLCLLINKLLLLPGWLVTGRCHLAIVSKLIEQFVLGRGLGLGPGLGAETRPSHGLYAHLSTVDCTALLPDLISTVHQNIPWSLLFLQFELQN